MKKILVISGLLVLLVYLFLAVFFFGGTKDNEICNSFDVIVTEDQGIGLVESSEIEKQIDEKGLNPYGKPLKDINTYEIEKAIEENLMVKTAEVFVTGNGGIKAVVKNRKPILRIISSTGENYYIDKEGERVPYAKNFVADLPLATGAIEENFAKTELYDFALFLIDNPFWDNQIEQIVVVPYEEIKLVPRVGDQEIILGKLDGYQEKLNKLKRFYEKGLSEVGWNRYSTINLKYDKQVVGTKR